MKVNIIVEQTKDGFFSCYLKEEIPHVAPLGYGESSEEAIQDLLGFYEEERKDLAKDGVSLPDLEYTVHYDMGSFFNRFKFLNQTKIAELAGINPSLLRKYTSGVANASARQYEKLQAAIAKIAMELKAAAF